MPSRVKHRIFWRNLACSFALMTLAVLTACNPNQRAEQLFTSCQNHRGILNLDLQSRDIESGRKWQPPFQTNVAGHVMLATFAGGTSGALNCHHGAPGMRVGGWQAVNVPPEKWPELYQLWSTRHGGEVPFYWCGKSNALQKRVFCTLSLSKNGDWFVDHYVLKEAELQQQVAQLNRCLSDLKLPAVPTDVPDAVPWASFDTHGWGATPATNQPPRPSP